MEAGSISAIVSGKLILNGCNQKRLFLPGLADIRSLNTTQIAADEVISGYLHKKSALFCGNYGQGLSIEIS
ncbi:hypothetical protein NIASO_06240 [Niabella soli DSM 19437]|uniref:Uncharacterized protein n=1 Tax=Niabella soli DSM 19437 TaxID=929713 RepID=W0F7D2_9BACT|nr:hypothetical protein NIASO_06240 [Niabella soli DSM 19437]